MKSRNRYSDLVKSGSIAKSRLQPPEIKDPVKFSNNPKNKNYTMERMPILDGAKESFTFDPKLPDDYLKNKDQTKKNVEVVYKPDTIKDKDPEEVVYKPDTIKNVIENVIKPEPEPYVPSWLRVKK
tara:strand:+ start:63 stop:440 length:378 start_codon:yes stop_codon:yes gene_type:complete